MSGFEFDAKLLQEEDRERLTSSAALMQNPLPYGHYLKDNLFLLSRIDNYGQHMIIRIDDDIPPMTFDTAVSDAIYDRWGVRIPTVSQIKRLELPQYTAITTGAMVKVYTGKDEREALLQREIYPRGDSTQPKVAAFGQYISPSGAADGPLLHCMLAECEEELLMLAKASSPTAAFQQLAGRNAGTRDIPLILNFNGQTGIDTATKWNIVEHALKKQGLEANTAQPMTVPAMLQRHSGLQSVRTLLNGRMHETFRAIPFYQAGSATMFLNLPVAIHLPAGVELGLHNGEAPGRPIRLMTSQEIEEEQKKKHENPDHDGGVFMMNRAAMAGVDNELPQDLRNSRNSRYFGPLEKVQRELAKREPGQRTWMPL